MKWCMTIGAALLLSACGVDGPPVQPEVKTETTVSAGSSGTHAKTTVTASQGGFSMGVGVGL